MKKNPFKIITVIIVVSLVALIVFQIISVYSVYEQMNLNFIQKVKGAVSSSLFNEKNNPRSDQYLFYFNSEIIDKRKLSNVKADQISTITIIKDSTNCNNVSATKITAKNKGNNSNIYNININKSYGLGVNGKLLDSLFNKQLNEAGIFLPYLIDVSFINNDKKEVIFRSDSKNKIINPIEIVSDFNTKDGDVLQVIIKISNPNKELLSKLSGIITSSFIITLLLIISFIYLLKTLFKSKELENMRKDFTHNITHELKTPVSVAYAASDALISIPNIQNDSKKRYEYLKIISDQLKILQSMIERILNVTVEEDDNYELNKENLNVKRALQTTCNKFKIKSDKEIEINLTCEDDLEIFVDKFHLNNILSNLIDNAIKYSNNKVRICINVREEGGKVLIEIADNGIGIKGANLNYIFDKYYRVPTGDLHNVKGYGIGLYYTKLLIEKHKGNISVKSTYLKGTTFIITLPKNG